MIVDKKYISYSEQFVVHWVSQRIDEKCGSDSRLSVNIQLDFEQVLFQSCDKPNDELNHIVFVVLLQDVTGYQKGGIEPLHQSTGTSMGFLRMAQNIWALTANMLENLPEISLSISSFFLTVKLTLQELMDGQIKKTSFLFLARQMGFMIKQSILGVQPVSSTQGLLSFSKSVEGKSRRQRAALRAALIEETQFSQPSQIRFDLPFGVDIIYYREQKYGHHYINKWIQSYILKITQCSRMDVVVPRVCEKHNKQANQMCTKYECFLKADILICPDCTSRHFEHRNDTIEMSLLNEKVHLLMKKRVEFQQMYDHSCEALINQLKKFKMFKDELFSSLNIRQRILNDLCKKIRRKLPYEKDKQLFKNHFGYIYLTMKGLNPNIQIYSKFRTHITQTMTICTNILRKFELNCGHTEIPTLLKKEYQISAILKKNTKEENSQSYFQPVFDRFKKQTIKFKNPGDKNSKVLRVNEEQFLAIQGDCLSWYNIDNFLFPKTIPLGKKLANLAIIDKNAFITTEEAGILIYDVINQKLLKEYASSNHKNASITGLLAINSTTVLNFITCPNQIVSLKFNEEAGTLKVHKGVETDSKQIDAKILLDNFVTLYDNKIVSVYKTEHLDKEREYTFESLMKSASKVSENIFAVGGECDIVSVVDVRENGIAMKVRVHDYCNNLSKIYPYSLLLTCGKNLKIYDIRMQKQLFNTRTDENIKSIQVLSSSNFVTSGANLTWWQSVQQNSV